MKKYNLLLIILIFCFTINAKIVDIYYKKDDFSLSSCSLKISLSFTDNEINIENENDLSIWISFSNSHNLKFTSNGIGLESSRRWRCELTSSGADSTTGYSIATLHGLNKNKNEKKRSLLCKITYDNLKTQKKRTNDDKVLMSQAVCAALEYSITTITIYYNNNDDSKNIKDSFSIEYDKEKRFSVSREYINKNPLSYYYLLTPSGSPQYMTRYENVMNVINSNSNSINNKIVDNIDKIGIFDAVFWENWDQIRFLFSLLKIPNKHMMENRGMLNRKGKYGRWASLIMSAAYAVQFNLPYLILLEDDSKWPLIEEFSASLRRILPSPDSPCIIKLSKWGEGYVFPLQGAKVYLRTIYDIGINKHSDTWIRDNMNVVYYGEIEHELLIWSNQGNILRTPYAVNHIDFAYNASWRDSSPLFDMISHDNYNNQNNKRRKKNLLFPSSKSTNFSSIIIGLKRIEDERQNKIIKVRRNDGKIQQHQQKQQKMKKMKKKKNNNNNNNNNIKQDEKLLKQQKDAEVNTETNGSNGFNRRKDWLQSVVRGVVSTLAYMIPAPITNYN